MFGGLEAPLVYTVPMRMQQMPLWFSSLGCLGSFWQHYKWLPSSPSKPLTPWPQTSGLQRAHLSSSSQSLYSSELHALWDERHWDLRVMGFGLVLEGRGIYSHDSVIRVSGIPRPLNFERHSSGANASGHGA